MLPKDADGLANNVDPDQTALGSGSALSAQAYLSENENLGSLWYLERQVCLLMLNSLPHVVTFKLRLTIIKDSKYGIAM